MGFDAGFSMPMVVLGGYRSLPLPEVSIQKHLALPCTSQLAATTRYEAIPSEFSLRRSDRSSAAGWSAPSIAEHYFAWSVDANQFFTAVTTSFQRVSSNLSWRIRGPEFGHSSGDVPPGELRKRLLVPQAEAKHPWHLLTFHYIIEGTTVECAWGASQIIMNRIDELQMCELVSKLDI